MQMRTVSTCLHHKRLHDMCVPEGRQGSDTPGCFMGQCNVSHACSQLPNFRGFPAVGIL